MKRAVVLALAGVAAVGALTLDPFADPQSDAGRDVIDPTRYCYSIKEDQPMPDGSAGVVDQPWSCYLAADRPRGHRPVWVGPQSQVRLAVVTSGGDLG